jgi:hypothetical protein
MRKKEIIWLGVLLILGCAYIHYFTNWFEKGQIGIGASLRPNRRAGGDPFMVVFTLNDAYNLNNLKVLPLDGDKFNPDAIPVWQLVSSSNSVATRAFRYGQPIRGMKPALKGVHPDPLTPGAKYRLIVTAGDLTGFKDFKASIPDR